MSVNIFLFGIRRTEACTEIVSTEARLCMHSTSSSGALLNSVFQPVYVRHLHNRQQNMLTCCIFPASHIVLEQTIQQLSLTTFATAHSNVTVKRQTVFLHNFHSA